MPKKQVTELICDLCGKSNTYEKEADIKSSGWITFTIGGAENWSEKCICITCVSLIYNKVQTNKTLQTIRDSL